MTWSSVKKSEVVLCDGGQRPDFAKGAKASLEANALPYQDGNSREAEEFGESRLITDWSRMVVLLAVFTNFLLVCYPLCTTPGGACAKTPQRVPVERETVRSVARGKSRWWRTAGVEIKGDGG